MRKILIPVNGSENALNAVRHVCNRYSTDPEAEVHLVHVNSPLPKAIGSHLSRLDLGSYYRDQAKTALAQAETLLSRFGMPYVSHVRFGDPAFNIQQAVQQVGASEIVMGTRRTSALTRFMQSSLTNQLMERVNIPVEVISTGEETALQKYGMPAGLGAALTLMLVAAE